MTTLLIIFILSAGHWEFSNIERIIAPSNAGGYCEHLARSAQDPNTRAFCMDDQGREI